MQLVIDANILLAGFGRGAITRELLLDPRLDLFAPEHLLIETERHLTHNVSLQKRIGLSKPQIRLIFDQLTHSIRTVEAEQYSVSMPEAFGLAAHPEDAPYLALALWKRIPLWSNDKGIKRQSRVQVYTTAELIAVMAGRSN